MPMMRAAHLHTSIVIIIATGLIGLLTNGQGQPCPGAIRTNIVNFRGSIHFVCLQPTTPPILDLIRYGTQQLVASIHVDERGRADKISSFVDDEGNLRIILAIPDRINGTSLYSIDNNGQIMREVHTVSTQFVDQLNTWKLELNDEWQLAIANQPIMDQTLVHGRTLNQRLPIPDPKPILSLYSWRSTYFDRYQLIQLPQDGHVSKLEPMNINGQEFLIVAMDSNRADKDPNFGLDSLIYKLDFGAGDLNWREFQRLPTKLAHDVKPFTLTHRASLQKDYYIAVLGKMKVIRETTIQRINVTDEEDGLIVYKYLGDSFVQINAYQAPDMTKLEAVTYGQGDNYVIVALLSERTRRVTLMSFDGLNFQVLPSPTNVQTRRVSSRQRRTKTNFQLFLAPDMIGTPSAAATTAEYSNETVAKRTLGDSSQAPIFMPVLTVSDPDLYPGDRINNSSSKAYQIPMNGIIGNQEEKETGGGEEEADDLDTSHSKRDYVPTHKRENYLLNWCKSTINSILLDNFDALSKQLLVLPRVDQHKPIELNGDLLIEDDLHISNLLYVSRIEETTGYNQQNVLIESNPSNFSHTFNEIQRVHKEIDGVKNRVDQILVDDDSEQNVLNRFVFDTLVVECHQPGGGFDPSMPPGYSAYNRQRMSCPHVNEIRTTFLNNRNISNIQQQALLTGRSMIIEGDVRFEHLVLHGNILINETLNGIPINEIVFKKGFVGEPIRGHKDFKNGLYSQSNLKVNNWRGAHIDRENYLTSSGDQTIPSMRFSQVIIDSMGFNGHNINGTINSTNHASHIERLNGLDLRRHLNQIALANTDNQFETPIEFDELIINGPIHMIGGLSRLSSIDLEELWRHTMFKHSIQNISVPIDFVGPVHVSYGGNIIVNGPVNGFSLKPSEVMMRDLSYNLPNPILFYGSIDVNQLEVRKALNGIQVLFNSETRREELSLLYNEGTQVISGDKVFGSIHLGANSIITGNINGFLNLSILHNLANSFDQPHHFKRIRLSGQDIRIAERVNIHISSTINGISTYDLCSLALSTYNKNYTSYRSLRFKQPIKFKSLRCLSVNGFTNLSGTFLTKYGNQYVSGDLRLVNGAIFNTTLNIQSTLNGLSIATLSRAISRSINETRTGHKDFYGDLKLEDLITDKINDLRLSDIFLAKADSPQIIRAPITFDHLDIENVLNVGNLMTNSFNNLNVTDLMMNTLTYDTPQVIYNNIQLDTLQLLTNSNLQTPTVNGHNLRRLFADAVMYDVPQQILSPKTFRGPVEFAERMFMRHRIDGLSFDDIKANLLLLSNDLIEGDLVLNNDCIIKKVLEIQSKTINDIDLDAFVNNMIQSGQPLRVAANGSIRFHDVTAKDVVVGGTIQGVDLSREAIWTPRLPTTTHHTHPPQTQLQHPLIPQQLVMLPPKSQPPAISLIRRPSSPQPQPPQQQSAYPAEMMMMPPDHLADYNSILRAHALEDLSYRINRQLSLNFYYEIVQKHPLLGPLMYYNRDSLFLKATGKPGEPCLHRGQTIAIMSKGEHKPPFTQTSRIQETSNPRSISSVANYLFVLDDDPKWQVLVYTWSNSSSLYELIERISLNSPALTIKSFISDDRICLIVASAHSAVYCQPKQGSAARLLEKTSIDLPDSIIDMDVKPIETTSRLLIATISQQNTRLIGDLTVKLFDTQTKQLMLVASKKMVKPLKLHFFKNGIWTPEIQLAVSEAITNNDNVQATSRIFSMRLTIAGIEQKLGGGNNNSMSHFHEIQEIRDNQFYDIQSVLLDESRSLLLFQSAHSISIYAPTIGADHSAACDAQYSLLQRIPTKGANKFLVFNDNNSTYSPIRRVHNSTIVGDTQSRIQSAPFGHFLVLSKDQCDEKQQFVTLILRALFK